MPENVLGQICSGLVAPRRDANLCAFAWPGGTIAHCSLIFIGEGAAVLHADLYIICQ